MKEPDKAHTKDFLALLATVIATILVCNCLTPALYRLFVGESITTHILNKLKEPGFAPDLIVFGSSKSWAGIDGYQMSDELGLDAYNFSSQEQQPIESSLYYEMLPSSVKTVVQIVNPPIKNQARPESQAKRKLTQRAIVFFTMNGYTLTEATKGINPYHDLTDLEKSGVENNFTARGSIFLPSLTNWLQNGGKKQEHTLKFDNTYSVLRNARYERTVEGLRRMIRKENFDSHGNIEIDTMAISALVGYNDYLKSKGIKMVAVIMPTNPDLEEFTTEQFQMIDNSCRELMPDVTFFNYLSAIKDPLMFYDAAHVNRDGAKEITTLLIQDIKQVLGK